MPTKFAALSLLFACAVSIEGYPWMYGIACELVTRNSPVYRITPDNNLLHDNGSRTYYFYHQ